MQAKNASRHAAIRQERTCAAAQSRISDPGDAQEREADRVAERVVRMLLPTEAGGSQSLQAASPVRIARNSAGESVLVAVPLIGHESLPSSGRPLDADARAFLESQFGCSFE